METVPLFPRMHHGLLGNVWSSLDTQPFSSGADLGDHAAAGPPPGMPQGPHAWPENVSGFKLVEKVHQGCMSSVWRAVDEARQTSVAKRLRLSASLFFGLTDSAEDVGAYLTFGRRY